MSVKSIGYRSVTGRGGKYIVPNITVKDGQIVNIEPSDLPQIEYANGVSEYTTQLASDTAEYESDLSLYDIGVQQLVTETNEYNKLQVLIDNLQTLVDALSIDVNAQAPSQVILNYSYNSTPYGLYGALNSAPWPRAGPIDTTYAAPVLGNYIRSILYDYPVSTAGLYHLRVSLALTQQRSGTVNVNGVTYQARAMPGASNQVSFIYIYLDGVLHSVLQSCCWDYYSSNIYIAGAKFLDINAGQKLSVGIMFLSDVSASLDIPSQQIGFFWNLNDVTSYVAPPQNLNAANEGASCLKLTYINGPVS
jgi:hypothetical protein